MNSTSKYGLVVCAVLALLCASTVYAFGFNPNINFSLSDPILGNWSWYTVNLSFNSTTCIYQNGNYTEIGTWHKLPDNQYFVNCTDTSTVYSYDPATKMINGVFRKSGV